MPCSLLYPCISRHFSQTSLQPSRATCQFPRVACIPSSPGKLPSLLFLAFSHSFLQESLLPSHGLLWDAPLGASGCVTLGAEACSQPGSVPGQLSHLGFHPRFFTRPSPPAGRGGSQGHSTFLVRDPTSESPSGGTQPAMNSLG